MTDVEYLTSILKPLVDVPSELVITRTVDDMGVLLTVKCGRDDMGRVIGRSGATAKAIRTVLRVFGTRVDARINMKLLEPEGKITRTSATLDDAISHFTSSKTVSS